MKDDIITSIDNLEKKIFNKRREKVLQNYEKEIKRLKKIKLFAKRDLLGLIKKLDELDLGLNNYQFEELHSSFDEKFLVRIFITGLDKEKIKKDVLDIINWIDNESVMVVSDDRIYGKLFDSDDSLVFWII
jgi:cupin superfamily acireductone dioxygenase involved in methionine salvage